MDLISTQHVGTQLSIVLLNIMFKSLLDRNCVGGESIIAREKMGNGCMSLLVWYK